MQNKDNIAEESFLIVKPLHKKDKEIAGAIQAIMNDPEFIKEFNTQAKINTMRGYAKSETMIDLIKSGMNIRLANYMRIYSKQVGRVKNNTSVSDFTLLGQIDRLHMSERDKFRMYLRTINKERK